MSLWQIAGHTMDREELTSAEAFKRMFDSNALLLRTTMPAQVVSVDLVKNTVSVQPCLMGKMENESGSHLLPIINDAQIQYYGAGDLWITFEPKEGDYCILSISDRSIEAWKKVGGTIDPKLNRHHDMSDAFAYFGINPFPRAIPSVEAGTMHIRTRDGSTGIKIKPDAIKYDLEGVEVASMTSSLVTFNVPVSLVDVTSNGKNISGNHTHSGVQTGGGNTGGPNP